MWLDEIKDLKLPELTTGKHKKGSKELCLMELIAFMEREPHSDRPQCVCDTMVTLGIMLNDLAPDNDYRQRLLRLAPMLVGTATHEDRVAPTRGYSPQHDLYVIRRMEGGRLREHWGHQREMYVTPAEMRAEQLERLAYSISGDRRGLKDMGRERFHWNNPYERAYKLSQMIGELLRQGGGPNIIHNWLMAYATLESMIVSGPHTPEQKGWVAPRELKRAKQWVKEYAVVA